MGNYNKKYITKEEFENMILTQRLYEGYVIGVGYAYCETDVMPPTHLHGSTIVWGNRPTSYTHFLLATKQCFDTSPGEVLRSLRLTPENFSDVLVVNTDKGTNVNMGNGKIFFIPSGANHKIDTEIRDTGNSMVFRIKAENLDTKDSCQTECNMLDFPVVFGTYPKISTSLASVPEKQGVGQPGLGESMIPFWGSGRAAVDHFQNGNYWRGSLYSVLAISDVFLLKSIVTGLAKGAFKIAGSHSWGATRRWMLKHNYTRRGEDLHHWAIRNATGKKYNIEAISNQPWNLVNFANHGIHIRAGHGMRYMGDDALGLTWQLWYGTPHWFKAAGTSTVGRGIVIPFDGIYTNYEQSGEFDQPK